MKQTIMAFLREEDGVTAIEYGLIAGVIAVVIIAAFGGDTGLGAKLKSLFSGIGSALDANTPSTTGG